MGQDRGSYDAQRIFFHDDVLGVQPGTNFWAISGAPIVPASIDITNYHSDFDDFKDFDVTSATGRYVIAGDASTVALTDAAGGVLSIPTGANDNDEKYVKTIAQTYVFAADKSFYAEFRVKLTEANTDDANIIVGVSDTVGANLLLDNGAGPAASYDGAVWFKVDGGTVWQFETSNAGTQVTTASAGAFTSAAWTRLGIRFDPADGTTGSITPYLNGVAGTPHAITLAGLEEMNVVVGVKAGGANVETLLWDYHGEIQLR